MNIGNWILKAEARGLATAFEYKQNHKWHKVSWQDYIAKVVASYSELKRLGLSPKSHVGLMSTTRWEWATLDLSLLGSENVVVPFYPNLSDEDLLFIVNDSDIKVLIVEDESHKTQIDRIKINFDRDVKIIQISEINFETEFDTKTKEEFFSLCKNLDSKSRATIVYTSGTSGRPKGAVLLHKAIASEVTESFELFGVKSTYKSLTFLPYAHVLGRIEHWGSCWNGHTLAYAESIEKMISNFKEVKPDFLIAVPRIFEKIYSGIMAQVETNKYKQKMFSHALNIANQIEKYRRTKEAIPWSLLLQYETLSKTAFAPIQKAFGGSLKFAVCGGAPISAELVDFFAYCRIPILEGYGLTETCAAVTVNSLSSQQSGSVGRPIGDVQIKFAPDGEILIKSKKCLVEYYKNPAETKKNIKDGYFATGDIGEFTEQGFLKITDRKKDLIKTAGGKYVAPQKLEGLLKQDPLISHVLIHGDQKKYISALITFNEAQLKQWSDSNQLNYSSVYDIYKHQAFKLRLQQHLQSVNSKLSSFEAIKKYEIIVDDWTVENGSLTQSLKVKRKLLEARYVDIIDSMYE